MNHFNLKQKIGFLLVLVLGWIIYYPGLAGTFLFDDFGNLPVLGKTGSVDDLATFWRFITSGHADPTGRPISLLSFLLDAHDWPTPALPFKRTNLWLHLLNGALLFRLLSRLGDEVTGSSAASRSSRIDAAAALGAALWLLHPLFVSTTLYIVQREAMLPALFTLAGLLSWLHGRRRFEQGRVTLGVFWTVLGLGGCTVLAALSKANGALLPSLALTIEFAFLRPLSPHLTKARNRTSFIYSRSMLILAWVPTAAIAAYLAYEGWRGFAYGISAIRPWTLAQRLLTEPRILVDYLGLLWLPRPFTPGLFNDHIRVSTSLWSPLSTLPALVAVVTLVAAAVLIRRRVPALALAILFFFVGQSLESSTIALELFFEHRNYLPALLMFWPLALWLCDIPQGPRPPPPQHRKSMAPETRKRLKISLSILSMVGLACMTHSRAALWGNTHDQALLWAQLNPSSPRAQAHAAQAEIRAGHPAQAATRLRQALAATPDEIQLALNLLAAECQMGHINDETLQAAADSLRVSRNTGSLLEHWFERALEQSRHPSCPEMNLTNIEGLLDAARANAKLATRPGRAQEIMHLQGRVALMRGKPSLALSEFNRALDQQVRVEAALQQAALLGASGYPELGLAHLAHYDTVDDSDKAYRSPLGMARLHAWVLHRQGYWSQELERLRATLRKDAHSKQTTTG